MKFRKKFKDVILIRVNSLDNTAPPHVLVPIIWHTDNNIYKLRVIVFHNAEINHYSSLVVKRGHFYTSQRKVGDLSGNATLCYEGPIFGADWPAPAWDGQTGRPKDARIYLVVYTLSKRATLSRVEREGEH